MSKPVATSIRVDHEHTLEMRADMETKTAEVENVTTGEMYTGGGGDSDFSTAEVTIISEIEISEVIIPLVIIAEANELGEGSPACVNYCIHSVPIGSSVYKTPLYKGGCIIGIDITNTSVVKSYSGSIAPLDGEALISGNCTIELEAGQ